MAHPTATLKEPEWFRRIAQAPVVQDLLQRLEKGEPCACQSLASGTHPFLAALLHHYLPSRRIFLVTAGVKAQEQAAQDLETLAGLLAPNHSLPLLYYPSWEVLPHEDRLPHADIISERLETLLALSHPKPAQTASAPHAGSLGVANVAALTQRTLSPQEFFRRTRTVKVGDHIDPLDLVEWLEDQGYEPEIQVSHKGEIALKGGILDIFPLSSPWPVRLEFFGDEIESIRSFDSLTQMSRDTMQEATLPPGGELGVLKQSAVSKAKPDEPSCTLMHHLSAGDILILSQPDRLFEHAASYQARLPATDSFHLAWPDVLEEAKQRGVTVIPVQEDSGSPGDLTFDWESLEAFRPLVARSPDPPVAEVQRREFFHQVHRWIRQGCCVTVFCNNEGEKQRFEEIWAELGLASPGNSQDSHLPPPSVQLGALTQGFLAAAAQVVVVTDAEIFGRYKVQRPRRLKRPHASTTRSLLDIDFADLEEGDYVVHLEHGIGRYVGLAMLPVGGGVKPLEKARANTGESQECLVLEYAPSQPEQPPAKLYVPVNEAHLVSKYVGAGKARPPLHSLGGKRWQKAKDQAEQAVQDLAAEFLSLQAAREALEGHAFPPDTPWQREFESAFLYEETPDQWQAIVAAKADLEKPKPMDRLICGDVGYGKTEVALRAAFKAVMGGKQVAVLVPTTVLAQQHYNTFRERMADYPIRIELLSRFRTAAQQSRVIDNLASGAVDIVVGTHRLIQKDVAFKDLGLVVVDEEQRFGVMHKEQFKRMRRLVDVLTLSATPIPRTLYLALTGARDMSTIETPPQDRLPVETIVAEFDERLIRDAIERELNRDGQVFFLHNRVFDIENVAVRLKSLVPKARIVIGHGQMHADELETVMTQFVNGEADVLLSTTIIESGIDIPNANTIIIDRADRFGLSDLYQLRGRVGRYKHQAYAYLLIPRHARMLTDARKRISAIKQYSTLGSGFKIAMRDLEIRGAGNLLGPQQSGHITAVGFDLYCQLLKQSVLRLKGEPCPPRVETVVKLDFLPLHPVPTESGASPAPRTKTGSPETQAAQAHAFIPFDYVPEGQHRIQLYRKLAEASKIEDVKTLQRELRDRFGPLPNPVVLLLQIAELRLLAASKQISTVEARDDKLMLARHQNWITVGGKFPRLTKKTVPARLKEIGRLLQSLHHE